MNLAEKILSYYAMLSEADDMEPEAPDLDMDMDMPEGPEAPEGAAPKKVRAPRAKKLPASPNFLKGAQAGLEAAKKHLETGTVYTPHPPEGADPEEAFGYHHAYHHALKHNTDNFKAAKEAGKPAEFLVPPAAEKMPGKMTPQAYDALRAYHRSKTHDERAKAIETFTKALLDSPAIQAQAAAYAKNYSGPNGAVNPEDLVAHVFGGAKSRDATGTTDDLLANQILHSTANEIFNPSPNRLPSHPEDKMFSYISTMMKNKAKDLGGIKKGGSKKPRVVSMDAGGKDGEGEGYGASAAAKAMAKNQKGSTKNKFSYDPEGVANWFQKEFPHNFDHTNPKSYPKVLQSFISSPDVDDDNDQIKQGGSKLLVNRPDILAAALKAHFYNKDGQLHAPEDRLSAAEVARQLLGDPQIRGRLVKPLDQRLAANPRPDGQPHTPEDIKSIEAKADKSAAQAITAALSDFNDFRHTKVQKPESAQELSADEVDALLSRMNIKGKRAKGPRAAQIRAMTQGGDPAKEPAAPDWIKSQLGEPPPLPGEEPDSEADPQAHIAWRKAKMARDKWDLDKDTLLHQAHGKLPANPKDFPELDRTDTMGREIKRGRKPIDFEKAKQRFDYATKMTQRADELSGKEPEASQEPEVPQEAPPEADDTSVDDTSSGEAPADAAPQAAPASQEPDQQKAPEDMPLPEYETDFTPQHVPAIQKYLSATPEPDKRADRDAWDKWKTVVDAAKSLADADERSHNPKPAITHTQIRQWLKQGLAAKGQAKPAAAPAPETPPAPAAQDQDGPRTESLAMRIFGVGSANVARLTEWVRARKR